MTSFDFGSFSDTLRGFVSMKPDFILYNVRVMFKFKDSDSVNFKIITDTVEGIEKFVKSISELDNLVSLSYEYLSEFNCNLLGQIVNVFNKEV